MGVSGNNVINTNLKNVDCCNIILFVILLVIVRKLFEINIFSFQLPDWATENGGLGTMDTFARRQVLIFSIANFFNDH